MKLIVVGFKTTEDNFKELAIPIYYAKALIGEDVSEATRKALFGTHLEIANKRGVDFVSIRFVRKKSPIQELQESIGDVV